MATVAAEAINLPSVPHSGSVLEVARTANKESRLVFLSLLPSLIYLLSNLRQDDSCRCSVPRLTSAYNDIVKFTDHAPILCSFN